MLTRLNQQLQLSVMDGLSEHKCSKAQPSRPNTKLKHTNIKKYLPYQNRHLLTEKVILHQEAVLSKNIYFIRCIFLRRRASSVHLGGDGFESQPMPHDYKRLNIAPSDISSVRVVGMP